MHNINETKSTWNKRVLECREEKKWSQEKLAEKLAENTSDYKAPQQKTISNWEHVGLEGTDGTVIGFPKMENILQLANLYNKDVGYFLGETDYNTFDHEKACQCFGFDKQVGDKLKKIFKSGEAHTIFTNREINRRIAFSYLVRSKYFEDMLDSIAMLYDAHSTKISKAGEGLEDDFSSEEINKAYEIYISPDFPYEYDENNLDEQTRDIFDYIDTSINILKDEEIEKQDSIDRQEYFLQKTFGKIIESLNDDMKQPHERVIDCPLAKKMLDDRDKENTAFLKKLREEIASLPLI